MPPYAVRVRTATGWQDIALSGPPGKSIAVFEQPGDPGSAAVVGDMWIDTDAAVPVNNTIRTMRTGQSYVVGGALAAGMVIPSFFVPVFSAAGNPQTTKIISVLAKIASGTSIIANVLKNGAAQSPSPYVTTTKGTTTFSPAITIADGDEIGLALSGPVGSPANLSLTIVFEHTV